MSAAAATINIFQTYVAEDAGPFDISKLSDRLRRTATQWTTTEAYLCVLLAASMADGSFDAEEGEVIQAAARRSRVMRTVGAAELAKANDVIIERLRDNPRALDKACATLPLEMCLPVFAHCVEIVLADGRLMKKESEFLHTLTGLLDIKPEHATRVLEVLLLKAQY